jgi:hypothetical protein
MTSILNLFSDKKMFKNQKVSPSLNQGIKFKKYQNKIENNLVKNAIYLTGKEGFSDMNIGNNGLTASTNEIIDSNPLRDSRQQQIIDNLRQEYKNTLKKYQTLASKIKNNLNNYVDRINPNNPYLNKIIQFTTGEICYVTNKGIVKLIPSTEILQSLNVPQTIEMSLTIPWLESYNTPGTVIATSPPLISGTNVQMGQSLGNEGLNIFVNNLINNPQSNYIGCYNKSQPISEVNFIPIMNSSNNVNGFVSSASSTYQGKNTYGPWAAFTQNSSNFWHCEHSKSSNDHLYNKSTGDYIGKVATTYQNSLGERVTSKGEYLRINLPGFNTSNVTKYPLTKYDIQGRQDCCGTSTVSGRSPNSWVILGWEDGTWYLVDEQSNQNLNYAMKTYTVSNPRPYQAYMFLTTNVGSPDDKTGNRTTVQIAQWNLYTTTDYTSNSGPTMNDIGTMTFDQCKMMAINTGNKYFNLNNPDQSGVGMCSVANDLTQTQQYGTGYSYNPIPLWDSKTNSSGTSVTLDGGGSLQILNSSGQIVFTTPVSDSVKSEPNTYIGCFNYHNLKNKPQIGKNYQYTIDECMDNATSQNAMYVGYGGGVRGDKIKRCFKFDDLQSAQMKGISKNCNTPNGGNHSADVYATDNANSSGNCFLILQDDGNMCIYNGTGPNDNQGLIWQSETNGKQQEANPAMTADKSRFGRNYMVSGEQLLPNEYIGSTDGSIYLIMQTDGNLVLYTNTVTSLCSTNNGNYFGVDTANALNQITQYGNQSDMGKIAYIDADSNLYNYPTDNMQYNSSYRKIQGMDTLGNDIPGAALGNTTLESCQTECNNNPQCAGIVTNAAGDLCWPKTSGMFPFGGSSQVNSDRNIYIRGRQPANPPFGVSSNTQTIDSVTYQNYLDKGPIGSQYGLANATNIQKQELEQLQTRMNLLSNQINNLTGKFQGSSLNAENQSTANISGTDEYIKNIKTMNDKMSSVAEKGNINNILKDSDIVVLQKNYDYLFWSILAAGSVLVSMSIIKK